MSSYSRKETLEKIGKYCAYQDRCHAEVRRKLQEMGTPADEIEDLMVTLIEEGFLDEERFARAFTRGKFRQKSWGRRKIRHELRARQIGERLIDTVIATEINEDEYLQTAREVAKKRLNSLKKGDDFEKARKTEQYLYGRGFEWEVIREVIT